MGKLTVRKNETSPSVIRMLCTFKFFVTHSIEEAVYLGDRVLLLGGEPAQIINEYHIGIDRAERRESEAFLHEVDKVRSGLQAAIDAASAKRQPRE